MALSLLLSGSLPTSESVSKIPNIAQGQEPRAKPLPIIPREFTLVPWAPIGFSGVGKLGV